MDDKLKLLMTGAGAPGGPGIIKALERDKKILLHVADMNVNASGCYLCENFHLIPKASDDNFIEFMLELCSKHSIDVIFPLVTSELFKFSKFKAQFEAIGVKIIVSDFKALSIANNKGKLYKHLSESGIHTPKFIIVDCKEALEDAVNNLGYPKNPVVMKPCEGNGSRGIRVLDPSKNRFDLLFNMKPNTLNSTLEEVLISIGNRNLPDLVVSEYLPGDELTIDTIVEKGEMKDCLIRARDLTNGGISVAGRFIKEEQVVKYVEKIILSLPELHGPIGFQVKKDINGIYQILECNPRIQGTSVSAMGLDINLPLRAINVALGKTNPKIERIDGIGFVRYYNEVFYEC